MRHITSKSTNNYNNPLYFIAHALSLSSRLYYEINLASRTSISSIRRKLPHVYTRMFPRLRCEAYIYRHTHTPLVYIYMRATSHVCCFSYTLLSTARCSGLHCADRRRRVALQSQPIAWQIGSADQIMSDGGLYRLYTSCDTRHVVFSSTQ